MLETSPLASVFVECRDRARCCAAAHRITHMSACHCPEDGMSVSLWRLHSRQKTPSARGTGWASVNTWLAETGRTGQQ